MKKAVWLTKKPRYKFEARTKDGRGLAEADIRGVVVAIAHHEHGVAYENVLVMGKGGKKKLWKPTIIHDATSN